MSESIYLYAFLSEPFEGEIAGLKDAPVRCIEEAGVYAAISEAPSGRIRPQRRLLSAHQSVLSALAVSCSTLPTSFGSVAESEDEIRSIMLDHADDIRRELEHVQGCLEFGVKVSWDTDNVFEQLVLVDDGLRSMRDALIKAGDRATHDQRVEVGRRADAVIAIHRDAYSEEVRAGLEAICRDLVDSPLREERELAATACLVERDSVLEFERAVEAMAESMDESLIIALAGPFAPHSFVDLRLETNQQAA